jgi:hypothetical protein
MVVGWKAVDLSKLYRFSRTGFTTLLSTFDYVGVSKGVVDGSDEFVNCARWKQQDAVKL